MYVYSFFNVVFLRLLSLYLIIYIQFWAQMKEK